MEPSTVRRLVCGSHGAFILAAGLWPLVHLPSFELVTGPKREDWLVKGMGTVLAVIGGTLVASSVRRRVTPEVAFLANGVGLGLATLDVFYSTRGTIRRIYRVDAVVQVAFAAAWAATRLHRYPVPTLHPTGSPDLD